MSERRLTDAELEASRWIARLEASDVTLEDHQRFRAWLDASPEHRAAHEALSRTWDRLDGLKFLGAELEAPSAVARPSRRGWLLVGGAAAVAAATGTIWLTTAATTFAATYATPTGGRAEATLQDGSEIELNAGTEVRVAFTARTRTASLDRGEALFTIATDGRPFEVRTPYGTLIAEGTVFLVKIAPDLARASVIAGHVRGRSSAGSAEADIAGANQELVLSSSRPIARADLAPARAANRLAWRDHMLAFDGETLVEAAADVERQTGVQFRFARPELGELRVGGYIDGRDANAFARLVEANLRLSVRREGERTFIIA